MKNRSHALIKHDFDEQMSLLNQDEMKEKAKVEDEKKDEEKEDPKGIPEFWLTVFKNVDLLSDMLQVCIYRMREAVTLFCSQWTDLLPPAGQVMFSTELFKYSAGSGNWNRFCLHLNMFLLYRSTMNPSSNIYKTLKYTFQIQDSQWWVSTVHPNVFFFIFKLIFVICLISRASH